MSQDNDQHAHHPKRRSVPNRLLRQERELRGWSQEQVAKSIGTYKFMVTRWENGTNSTSPHYRKKLCELFDKSAAELGFIQPRSRQSTPTNVQEHPENNNNPVSVSLLPLYDPAIPRFPLSSADLVGRDTLLASLKQHMLMDQHDTTLALDGLPGVGKTAVAVALTRDPAVRAFFSGGILWAGLGQHPNASGLLSRWAKLLGLSTALACGVTSVEDWSRVLHEEIGTRRMLLIIDAVWDVNDVLAFLIGGPHCMHLVTTRLPETALQVAGNNVTTVRELSIDDGTALILRLVPEATGVTSEVRTLVHSVGGLPLALTLMGRYLRAQTHSRQSRRLSNALTRLRSAAARLSLKQPTDPTEGVSNLPNGVPFSLQAVIGVSAQHLHAEARATLRTLSVFPAKPNTFSEEAALTISTASTDALDALTDAGLIESRGESRYTFHQTIADYARLSPISLEEDNGASEASEHMTEVKKRMVAFFVNFVETYRDDYDRLAMESSNILAAFELAQEQELSAFLLRGVNAFANFWEVHGQHTLAEQYLRLAQEAAQALGDSRGLALIWLHLGRLAELRGHLKQASQLYEQGVNIARQSGHQETIGKLLVTYGNVLVDRGEHNRAESYLLQAMELARELHNKSWMANILTNLGEVADSQGKFQQGNMYYEEGLRLAQESNDDETISMLLQNLGVKAMRWGNYEQAQQLFAEALLHAQKIKHQPRITAVLMNLGFLALKQKDFALARELTQESLRLARSTNNRLKVSCTLQNMGILETQQEHYEQATNYFQESYDIAREIEHEWAANETLNEWGELHLKRGEWSETFEKFQYVLGEAQKMQSPELRAMALYGLARVAAARQKYSEARSLGRESYDLYIEMGHERGVEIGQWLDMLPPIGG